MMRADLPETDLDRFRALLAEKEIDVLLDSTLRTLPGSVHLHLRPRAERTGVLEYTLDRKAGRAWLSWHENRYRPWIDAVLAALGAGPARRIV